MHNLFELFRQTFKPSQVTTQSSCLEEALQYSRWHLACLMVIGSIVVFTQITQIAHAQDKPATDATETAAGAPDDLSWPRSFETPSGATMVLHQPQVTAWDKFTDLTAMVAAEYSDKGSENKALGVISVAAKTVADKDAGTVVVYDITVKDLNFSTLDRAKLADAALEVGKLLPTDQITMSLDRLTAGLAGYEQVQNVEDLQTEAPPIHVEKSPAILVQTNGEGVTAGVELTKGLSFVVNTNWDILKTEDPAAYFLRDDKSWLTADELTGPWQPVDGLPKVFDDLPDNDNWKEAKAAIPGQPFDGAPPIVVYSDKPAELINIDGEPKLDPVGDTDLAWVSNTKSDLFFQQPENNWYFLTSGRWFRTADLMNGPWTFATPDLPADFLKIPADQPYSTVRVSIPGTSESDEARLQASIPHTARVERDKVSIDVTYTGDPEFVAIKGTSLAYAVNTSFTVIRVGEQYFVIYEGVWFVGDTPTGPFAVTDTVPDEIYEIPPTSPVYNVTYVKVYSSTPTAVWFGYTAGYRWGYLAWGTYVYGTGYYYPPYWYRRPLYPPIYYPRPVFYGGGVYYTNNGGWGRYGYAYGPYRGIEAGAYYNPTTGRYARGGTAYGPYGQRSYFAAGNVNTGRGVVARGGSSPYASWGSVGVTNGSNWAVARGYSNNNGGGVGGWNTSRGNQGFVGKTANSDLYAGRNGNVYRKTDDGWQKYNDGGWNPVNPPDANSLTSLGKKDGSSKRDGQAKTRQNGETKQKTRDAVTKKPTASNSKRTTQKPAAKPKTRQTQKKQPQRKPAQKTTNRKPQSGTVHNNLNRSYNNRQRGNARASQARQQPRGGQQRSGGGERRLRR